MKKILILLIIFTFLSVLTSCQHRRHRFSGWIEIIPNTCTQNGVEERVCKCGEREERTTYATGHTYGNWEIIREASCEYDGMKERRCACGETYTEFTSSDGETYCNRHTITASGDLKDSEGFINTATYNTARCKNFTTESIDVKGVADFIYNNNIAICALQEVCNNMEGGDYYHQARYISCLLTEKTQTQYYYAFAPSLSGYHDENAYYGNAIISKYPILSYRTVELKYIDEPVHNGYEHRILLIAEINVDGEILTVISTHFDLKEDARMFDADALLAELENIKTSVLLMGDLNSNPNSEVIQKILSKLYIPDADGEEFLTFPYNAPTRQIDYIMFSEGITVMNPRVITDATVSDHLPFVLSIKLNA